jgi:hypothetical protein
MKHNSITQSDTNMNFDGMQNQSPASLKRFSGNQWSGHSNDGREVNMGRGPTRGNMGCGAPGQPGATKSVTMDSYRDAPTSGVPAIPPQGSVRDSINRGAQVRTPGGTRAWMPSATQNYHGNPDKIRIGQSGGGTYNSDKPSKTPATQRGNNNFNFGPKSQY